MEPKHAKYRVTAGLVFVVFTIGIPWYYGNLATYNSSYFRFNSVTNSNDVDVTTWMLSTFFCGMSIGQLLSGSIACRLGLLKTLLVSILIFDVGIFLTYFAVQRSFYLAILTLMAVPGFCCGAIYALSFALVAKWFEGKYVGVASGFVSMAFSIGAIFYNEMITAVINPNNLVPDISDGDILKFFGQQEIMDRYPFVFVPIGILSVLLQFIGFTLLSTTINMNDTDDSHRSKGAVQYSSISSRTETDADKKHTNLEYNDENELVNDDKDSIENNSFNKMQQERLKLQNIHGNGDHNKTFGDMQEIRKDLTPRQALKTRTFYILWLTSFYMSLGYLTVANYYKIFGQLWIEDDKFLTTIGSISTITGALARILTGLAVDKFGVKDVMIGFTCTSAILLTSWYLSAQPSPWLYMVLTTTISAVFSSSFILFPLGALLYLGESHYPTNYGLVTTSTLLSNLLVPFVFPLLLHELGWYWLFLVVALLGPFLTGLLIIALPRL